MKPITPRPLVSPRLLHQLLNKVEPGDLVTIRRANPAGQRRYEATVTGPALVNQPIVGIDLFDGEPHLIRDENRDTAGAIVYLLVERGDDIVGAVTEA